MKAIKGCAVVGLGSFVFAVACSSGGASGSCGAYFDKLVALLNNCGATGLINSSERDAFVSYCNEIATQPGVSNFSAQIDACSQKINPNVCTLPNCRLTGSDPAGSACAASVQCTSGDCTMTGTTTTTELTCGTCAASAAAGADCTNAICDAGLYCDNTTKKCTAYVTQGGACTSSTQCDTGLQCDGTMKCNPPPGQGQACTTGCQAPYKCINQVCATGVGAGQPCPTGVECQPGLTCNGTTKTCEAPQTASTGQPCGFINNQFVSCTSGDICGGGMCEAPKQQGATCVVGNKECAINLVCVNGTCQVPDFSTCK